MATAGRGAVFEEPDCGHNRGKDDQTRKGGCPAPEPGSTALKSRLPFLDVNQERHVPLAGYTGVLELARQVDRALSSPVWDQVRAVPPWDRRPSSAGVA